MKPFLIENVGNENCFTFYFRSLDYFKKKKKKMKNEKGTDVQYNWGGGGGFKLESNSKQK